VNIEKLEYQYLDRNSSVKSILLNQTFPDLNDCKVLKETTNHLKIHAINSQLKRISVIKLKFSVVFAKIDELDVTLLLGSYRKCIVDSKRSQHFHINEWIFVCELKSLKNYKKDKTVPQSIDFFFKSEKIFRLSICEIYFYHFQDDCGTPETPLHAILKRHGVKSFEYFPIKQKNKHRMIGDGVITCLYDGIWDKEPPIFEPVVKCNTDEIDMNSSHYKSIEFEGFEFFNRTQVAVINSQILIQCNNEENSSKIHVSICNENGLWIGNDLKCKLKKDIV
jgi:hypothetical protein